MNHCSVVLLAAGRSRRLGFDKILTPIAGQPVLAYSLEVLNKIEQVSSLILVARKDIFEAIDNIVREVGFTKKYQIIEGGQERQDSVFEGLKAIEDESDYVAIHDAARPLMTETIFLKTLEASIEHGAAVCGQPAADTLKRSNASLKIEETVDRSSIWTVQTPQIFNKNLIFNAYKYIQEENLKITDDASAVEAMGKQVALVDSGAVNLKITRQQDWEMIEQWLNKRRGFRMRQLSHEICNHISPLVGYIPLLEKYGSDNEKFIDYMSKIKVSTNRLRETLETFQNLTRELFTKSKNDL